MSAAPHSDRRSLDGVPFLALFLPATVLSALLHELGHCIFYWFQGVPAGMSLVKEFPLRDITAAQYALGCLGGPLSNLAQLALAVWLIRRSDRYSSLHKAGGALLLANVFYLFVRGAISVIKGQGGELTDVAGLLGFDYRQAVTVFGVIAACALLWWVHEARIPLKRRQILSFVALLLIYVATAMILEAIDQRFFWGRFPTIQISNGRVYNPHTP